MVKNCINFGSILFPNKLSYRPQFELILKSCVCSLKWAQIELNCLIRLGDISFKSYLLLLQKADNGLYHPPILTWSYIKIRSAKHLNSFWTLIVNPNSVQNRQRNQSTLNFNPTSKYDTCVNLSLSVLSTHFSVFYASLISFSNRMFLAPFLRLFCAFLRYFLFNSTRKINESTSNLFFIYQTFSSCIFLFLLVALFHLFHLLITTFLLFSIIPAGRLQKTMCSSVGGWVRP